MNLRNLPFNIEGRLVRRWYAALDARPSSAPFVSGDSFRAIANHVVEPGADARPDDIESGDVVFVQSSELERFSFEVLCRSSADFVLITHNGDLNVDNSFEELASNRRIIRWFAQNALLRHPKVTALPIGLENRNLHCNGIIRDFIRVGRHASVKSTRILSGFSVQTNSRERKLAREILRRSPLVDEIRRSNSRLYRRILVNYSFVASPPGNGIDCHRTWEALYLGVVPIVRRSAFYESFPGLPVVAVRDWEEVLGWSAGDLAARFAELSPRIPATPYLKFSYWSNLIQDARKAA